MNSEIKKIEAYFEEVQRLWRVAPERALKREFYELWETVQRPVPFLLNGDRFELFGAQFPLPATAEKTGFFTWDAAVAGVALVVEAGEWRRKYWLDLVDGAPRIREAAPDRQTEEALTTGERLEIIYDVIAYVNRSHSARNVLEMTKKELVGALEAVGGAYPAADIAAMKRLPATVIRELLRNAAADMATDELSRQLSLPLDGSYAVTPQTKPDAMIDACTAIKTIPAKTRWEILCELNFLNAACRLEADHEKTSALTFQTAEIIGERGERDVPLKIRTDAETPLEQGEIMSVFLRGEKNIFGTFKVDIFDGNVVFGRLRSDFAATIECYTDRLLAIPQRGPAGYFAGAVSALYRAASEGIPNDLGALEYALAFRPFTFTTEAPASAPACMDASQQRAWAAVVNPANPIVLVQGPPGAGKTFVLEQVLRTLCRQRLRILVAAPSNAAVDNICRRIGDLPVLRFGKNINSIAPDVAEKNWIGEKCNVHRFIAVRREQKLGGIYAGTHAGLLRDEIVVDDMEKNGKYDVIVFDEAGMANVKEFMLCAKMGRRAALFGDHLQLPPFPPALTIQQELKREFKALPAQYAAMISGSAMEWLAAQRKVPVLMLQYSYRCQNPRLLRFSSTLFYNAAVKASGQAEYYQLAYHERKQKYPPSSLKFYTTSGLPANKRGETLLLDGQKPGLANFTEAAICRHLFYQMVQKYPLEEISIIVPYRKQVEVLRESLALAHARTLAPNHVSEERWSWFLSSRVATVDSFQGSESDVIIISYVRSNDNAGIGFVDNPNRINVAHTRCRREMHVVGDLECLKRQAGNQIFERMERSVRRDGEIVSVSAAMLAEILPAAVSNELYSARLKI